MRLNDDDLRAVLTRAQAIQGSSRRTAVTAAEMETFIQAAEEVGFARSAVEQALREHLGAPLEPLAAGELSFAKSADGKYYVAEIISADQETARVRFLRGGEQTVEAADLRPCMFVPGQRVGCNWPWWGPWTCTVQSYDARAQRISLSDGWGDARVFSIDEVWLNPAKTEATGKMKTRISVGLLAAGAGLGAVIGSIITALVMG
jgi:hypothetical protein